MNTGDWAPPLRYLGQWLREATEGTQRSLTLRCSSYGDPPQASAVSVEVDAFGRPYPNTRRVFFCADADDAGAALLALEAMAKEESES